VVQELLARGADREVRDRFGVNALALALSKGHGEVAELLLYPEEEEARADDVEMVLEPEPAPAQEHDGVDGYVRLSLRSHARCEMRDARCGRGGRSADLTQVAIGLMVRFVTSPQAAPLTGSGAALRLDPWCSPSGTTTTIIIIIIIIIIILRPPRARGVDRAARAGAARGCGEGG
jgi:hypothetical protein